ncbi:hypothetical protein LCGC14_0364020 [marine sediment metagenome]|uniref:Uncharacterized protein n=1 Tax=marine sediment metagenome TaxID=412755 RepID=A0A0F9WFK6_9ZZZZ
MPFHNEDPLTLNQLQTPASQVSRDAARGGAFPGPNVPSQQFTIKGGLQQLNSSESAQLQRVVNRLRRRREAESAPVSTSAERTIGQAFSLF